MDPGEYFHRLNDVLSIGNKQKRAPLATNAVSIRTFDWRNTQTNDYYRVMVGGPLVYPCPEPGFPGCVPAADVFFPKHGRIFRGCWGIFFGLRSSCGFHCSISVLV